LNFNVLNLSTFKDQGEPWPIHTPWYLQYFDIWHR